MIAQAPVKALMALGAMAAFIADVHCPAGEGDTAVRTVGGAFMAGNTAGRAAEALFQKKRKKIWKIWRKVWNTPMRFAMKGRPALPLSPR